MLLSVGCAAVLPAPGPEPTDGDALGGASPLGPPRFPLSLWSSYGFLSVRPTNLLTSSPYQSLSLLSCLETSKGTP